MITYQLDTICAPALHLQGANIATSCATDGAPPSSLPTHWELDAAPNPFNPSTQVRFAIPAGVGAVPVALRVHDITGRLVRTLVNAPQTSGFHDVVWNGTDDHGAPVATGIYFVRIRAGDWLAGRKIVLVK